MKHKATIFSALAVLAACQGRTDENVISTAENQTIDAVDQMGNELIAVGDVVENTADDNHSNGSGGASTNESESANSH